MSQLGGRSLIKGLCSVPMYPDKRTLGGQESPVSWIWVGGGVGEGCRPDFICFS